MEAMIQISKENPNQTSPIERALRFHADSKYNRNLVKFKFKLIESALTQIKQNQYSVEMMEGKGCTANVLMITNNLLICANAGDSRCVLGEGGRAVPMSTDHKPNLKKERDRIYRAGSTVNVEGRIDGNLNLSRAIGDIAHKKNPKL
jgi:serine/threonine protein phosphatase PrpC